MKWNEQKLHQNVKTQDWYQKAILLLIYLTVQSPVIL